MWTTVFGLLIQVELPTFYTLPKLLEIGNSYPVDRNSVVGVDMWMEKCEFGEFE